MKEHQDGGDGCASSEHTGSVSGSAAPQAPAGNFTVNPGGTGAMNAYDIPRYSSEGYVLGRPGTANDPMSAGMVYGAPAGGPSPYTAGSYGGPAQTPPFQPAPGSMGHGTMNAANGQAMAGSESMGRSDGQPSPATAYGTMGPAYGQAWIQVPPQAPAYMTMGPVYAQPTAGGAPAGQPGVPPPPGMMYMYHPGIDPAYAAAAAAANPYAAYPNAQQAPGTPGPDAQGGNAEHYNRIVDVVKDIANGEQPDVNKLAALYGGFDAQFWKGALIGAVLAVLLTSKTVKTTAAGIMGAIFGASQKGEAPSGAESFPETDAT